MKILVNEMPKGSSEWNVFLEIIILLETDGIIGRVGLENQQFVRWIVEKNVNI